MNKEIIEYSTGTTHCTSISLGVKIADAMVLSYYTAF